MWTYCIPAVVSAAFEYNLKSSEMSRSFCWACVHVFFKEESGKLLKSWFNGALCCGQREGAAGKLVVFSFLDVLAFSVVQFFKFASLLPDISWLIVQLWYSVLEIYSFNEFSVSLFLPNSNRNLWHFSAFVGGFIFFSWHQIVHEIKKKS